MRRAGLAAGAITLLGAAVGWGASLVSADVARRPRPPAATAAQTPAQAVPARPRAQAASAHHGPFAVGERTITFVDYTRTVHYPGHLPQPRPLVTVVRYPIAGPAGRMDVRDAPPDRAAGPFPLIVFGHGFNVTPAVYYRLLRAWAAAGFVVAAPVFPLENAHAPGGANESDLINQPADMSFVITGMLAASAGRHALLAGTIAPSEVAVSGQSDGGETALATAYLPPFRDYRVRAAVILSGAEIPRFGTLYDGPGTPALLASQGTADTTNEPKYTYAFYRQAGLPKFLLRLLGAPHLPPYTDEQPQLGIVERVSIAFLDRYLEGAGSGLAAMRRAGNRAGVATLTAQP